MDHQTPPMTHMRTKLSVAGLALAVAVAYLGFAGVRKGWVYYVDVDTFLADARYHDQRVRLCGRVAEDDLDVRRADLAADFTLLGPAEQLRVVYRGAVPEMFKAGSDVVIEGRLGDGGLFHADVLITKCASKYQAEEHAKRLEVSP